MVSNLLSFLFSVLKGKKEVVLPLELKTEEKEVIQEKAKKAHIFLRLAKKSPTLCVRWYLGTCYARNILMTDLMTDSELYEFCQMASKDILDSSIDKDIIGDIEQEDLLDFCETLSKEEYPSSSVNIICNYLRVNNLGELPS